MVHGRSKGLWNGFREPVHLKRLRNFNRNARIVFFSLGHLANIFGKKDFGIFKLKISFLHRKNGKSIAIVKMENLILNTPSQRSANFTHRVVFQFTVHCNYLCLQRIVF